MISLQTVWSSVIFLHRCISTSSQALGWQVFVGHFISLVESEIHQQLSNGFLLNFALLELLVYNFHHALTLHLWPLSSPSRKKIKITVFLWLLRAKILDYAARFLKKCDGICGIFMQFYAMKLRELAKTAVWWKREKKVIHPTPCSH